ncbi:DedA family protein [Actinoplanes sp. TRM 88003]|uniref:DedA family protein n=1 Tax=Paractinoplanes aksuensis TaxID=2939490 RepID=A0ABT1DPK7_9ACTN|nr:DedA family protein [Actinoplanes aksuensis]MCO8272413.1 DedA family protein [Actinoplanes aksuensis]
MTELLTMMATPAWAYLALFGFLAVDALIPVVPIQAIMITSGALTVYGNLDLALVIAVGALGMFTGDAIAFVLGRSSADRGSGRLAALRARYAPKHDDENKDPSRTKQAAARFTRGLRRPGPLVLLLCRFVPGGRMAAGFHAGRRGYPVKLFVLYDGAAALAWGSYGGLVGHIGGTAITQSAWRLFAIAATAAVVFGTAGWILALFGGRKDEAGRKGEAGRREEAGRAAATDVEQALAAGAADFRPAREPGATAVRAASADGPLPR